MYSRVDSKRPGFVRATRLRMQRTIIGLLAIVAGAAHAQNIVPNPNFDTVQAPWAQYLSSSPDPVGAGSAPFRAATPDFNNSPSSGSALTDIDTSTPATDAASGIAQCFDFSAATSVSFINYGGSFLVPLTTTADGSLNATVEIRLFANTGCSGFISGGSQGRVLNAGMASNTTWYTVGDTSFVPPGAPVMAASAQIFAYLRQTGPTPTTTDYKVNFDNFHLVLNSTTPVRLMQFGVE